MINNHNIKRNIWKSLRNNNSILPRSQPNTTNIINQIEKIYDLLWNLQQSFIDRSNLKNLDALEIGKITTIKVKVVKQSIEILANFFINHFQIFIYSFFKI